MPKEDKPPAYEDTISPPKYEEDSRHQPQNGHHDYGVGPDPPAPPPAYTAGTYPQQPCYGGYPTAAGTGYPPAGMPPSIIPTLSAGVPVHSQGSRQRWLPCNAYISTTNTNVVARSRPTNRSFSTCYRVLRIGDMDDYQNDPWESVSVRHAFIRKVSSLMNAFIAGASVVIINILVCLCLSRCTSYWLRNFPSLLGL